MRDKIKGDIKRDEVPAIEVASKETVAMVQTHIMRAISEEKYQMECLN